MKVTVCVPGRFHMFELAKQLHKRGVLSQLITSYPKFETIKYGIPREKIESVILKEIVQRAWSLLPRFLKEAYNPQNAIHELFDRGASRKLRPSDLFVGTLASYPKTMRKAKQQGAIVVVENGSAHTLYAVGILREEYERFGIKPQFFQLSHEKLIEKDVVAYEEADYISVPSRFVKRTFLEKGIPESKLIHVPYGVDLSHFHQIPKEDNVFRVVFAGGMTLQKGVHYLLRAFSELRLPNSELLLIGSISEEIKPFFKKYEGSFRYIGHVPQAELYKHYSQGSVFTMMSIQEGLALVQPQAMACGLPVIATTNTGAEDIVRDGKDGFIIPIRDVEKLKEKLIYLYEHPVEREEMAVSAKEHVSSGFTWDDYGDRIFSEYQRIYSYKK